MTCDECAERVQELEERISQLEALLDVRGVDDFAEADLSNVFVAGKPAGSMLNSVTSQVERLDERVQQIEVGEVDATEIVAQESEHQLPIQVALGQRRHGHDVSPANKRRATYVWQKFQDRAERSHGRWKLESPQVRNILQENDLRSDDNTVRRVMRMLAKNSGPADDPDSQQNLLRVKKGGKHLSLVAERDEWDEWASKIGAAPQSDDATDDPVVEDAGSESTAVESEAAAEEAALLDAEAVTDDSEDSIETEVATDGSG